MKRESPSELMEMISWIVGKSDLLNPVELDFIDDMDSRDCIGISIKQEKWIIDIFDKVCGGY